MKSTNSTTVRLMAWVMALCPLALGVLFHTGIQSTPLKIVSPRVPSLTFDQYAVDLKKIHPTTVVPGFFGFENRGSSPVRIEKLVPSCGCLKPILQGDHDKVIAPGDRGRVTVQMQPANTSPGPHEYYVDVTYTDPEPREVRLTLKLVIPEATISVSPPALNVYHPQGCEPTIQDFVITDGRGKPFEITDVTIDSDLVQTAIGESSRTKIGHMQQTVRVMIQSELPSKRMHALLRIYTSDIDIPELRVPIWLQGETNSTNPESDESLDHEESVHKNDRLKK